MKQTMFRFEDSSGKPVHPTPEQLEQALDEACRVIHQLEQKIQDMAEILEHQGIIHHVTEDEYRRFS